MVDFPQIKDFKESSAEEIDLRLGYQMDQVEKGLVENAREINQSLNTRSWIGLDKHVLNTPYQEICDIFEALMNEKIEHVIDLGAGYGRMGCVLSRYFPRAKFTGYEIINERVVQGNEVYARWGLSQCELLCRNILQDFEIPDAQVFFIYDFSNPVDLKLILQQFSDKMFTKQFFLVARGKAVRSLIQHQYPALWVHEDVIHQENWSIYASRLGE